MGGGAINCRGTSNVRGRWHNRNIPKRPMNVEEAFCETETPKFQPTKGPEYRCPEEVNRVDLGHGVTQVTLVACFRCHRGSHDEQPPFPLGGEMVALWCWHS